jgi:hypothetical protein
MDSEKEKADWVFRVLHPVAAVRLGLYKLDKAILLRDDGVAGMPEQEAAVALGYLGSTTKWPRSCVGKDGRTTPSLGHVGLNEEL